MKSFKKFLIEKDPRSSVATGLKRAGKNITDYVSDVASGVAADPLMFAKEYGKSLFTDPDTYHSGLAAAGMIPGIGELADVADAGIYAAQGDKEGVKASLASTVPLLGVVPAVGRMAKTGKKLIDQEAKDAIGILQSQSKNWKEHPEGLIKFETNLQDPFVRTLVQKIEIPTPTQISDLEELGAVIPDINKPQTTLTWREILQGVYGKDAEKFGKLATRGQQRLKDVSFDPSNITTYVFPSYSKAALDTPIDIHLGTHMANSRNKPEFSAFMPPNQEAAYVVTTAGRNLGDQTTIPININLLGKEEKITPSLLAHEAGHGIAQTDPKFKVSEIALRAKATDNPAAEFKKIGNQEAQSSGFLPKVFGERVPSTNISGEEATKLSFDRELKLPMGTLDELLKAGSPLDLTPKTVQALKNLSGGQGFVDINDPKNFFRVREALRTKINQTANIWNSYMYNKELPSQIGDAKTWMYSKGYPHVDVNMSADEAASLSKEIIEKWKKGFFPEIGGGTIQIIDMLGNPKGKAFWDTIAKRNKGFEVNQKVNQQFA